MYLGLAVAPATWYNKRKDNGYFRRESYEDTGKIIGVAG